MTKGAPPKPRPFFEQYPHAMERRASPPGRDAARLRFRRDPQKLDLLDELESSTGGKGHE
jgi:hypothetical protein